MFGELTIEGPLAFALCLDIHTLTGFGEVADLLDFAYLTAEDAVNICKAAYSQKAWYAYKSTFGLHKTSPETAHELMGWFVYESRETNILKFNGNHPLTRELAVSTLMQTVRDDNYRRGFGFYKYYPFGATHYISTLMGDSRNSAGNFSLPITSFIGSFHAQVVTMRDGTVGFRIDNDTTLESGTHIRGRFEPEYSGSVEELIERNPSLRDTPVQLLLWGEYLGGPDYRLISILESETRSETRGFEGGGNMFMTFAWKEKFDPCLGYFMYHHNSPQLLGVQEWKSYESLTFDPLEGMPGK